MAPGKATVAFLLAVAHSASALQSSSVTLEALLSDGTLRRFDRPPDYMERRQDGYEEPRTVYILGTNHRSKMSAEAARAVVLAVQPEVVVVELCATRQALLAPVDEEQGSLAPRGGDFAFGGNQESSFAQVFQKALKSGSVGAVALRLAMAKASDVASTDQDQGESKGANTRERPCCGPCARRSRAITNEPRHWPPRQSG